ncbi:hypothetical protein D3C71_2037640 [compost metagenome]
MAVTPYWEPMAIIGVTATKELPSTAGSPTPRYLPLRAWNQVAMPQVNKSIDTK